MATVVFNRGKANALNGTMNFASSDVRVGIIAGASVPAGASDPDLNTVADLLAVAGVTEAAASGYARTALAGKTVTENDANDRADMTATNVTWTSVAIGETWRAAFFYVEGANDAARNLIQIDTFATAVPTNGSNMVYPVSGGYLRGV